MKKLIISLILLISSLNTSFSENNKIVRKVLESKTEEAWKVDGKFIKPECFIEESMSGDNYEEFFDKYIGKSENSHRKQKNQYTKFVEEIGNYLNKEVPINDVIKTGWNFHPLISLTTKLNDCLSDKAETYVEYSDDGSRYTIQYKVTKSFDGKLGKSLAPNIKQDFESIKQINLMSWGGGSMSAIPNPIVYGVLNFKGEKILLPLRNKSLIEEVKVVNIVKNKFDLWLNSFGLPKPIIQDKNFYFGISYDGKPSKLLDNVEILISSINEDVYSKDKRYLTRYGCKPHDCGNKGFLWIDSKKKVAVGVINHSFWEKLDFNNVKMDQIFIFSNFFEDSKDLPDEFIKIYSAWIKKHNFKPPVYRFLNSKNELKIISGIK